MVNSGNIFSFIYIVITLFYLYMDRCLAIFLGTTLNKVVFHVLPYLAPS